MKCTKCGFELNDGAAFCPNCGAKVEAQQSGASGEPKTKIISKPAKEEKVKEPKTVSILDNPSNNKDNVPPVNQHPIEHHEIKPDNNIPKPVNDHKPPVDNSGIGQPLNNNIPLPMPNNNRVNPQQAPGSNMSGSHPMPNNNMQNNNMPNQQPMNNGRGFQQPMNNGGNFGQPARPGNGSAPSRNTTFCPSCGAKNPADSVFCGECGYRFNAGAAPGVKPMTPPNMNPKAKKVKPPKAKNGKSNAGKIIGIIAGVLAACLVIAAGIIFVPRLLSRSGGTQTYQLYYVKDNDIMTAKGGKYAPTKVSSKYSDSYDESEGRNWRRGPQFSPDNKYVFYLKKLDYSGDGDLYFQKVGKPDTEEKLASSVSDFVCVSSSKVVYRTDDGKLYYTDLKGNKEKISSDIYDYNFSKDKKNMLIYESDGSDKKLYLYNLAGKKAEKTKLATVTSVCAVSDNLDVIVYEKDDSLYVMKNFKDADKIASDVWDFSANVDDNDMVRIYYYVEKKAKELKMYDIIDDDMAAADANMKEPNIQDYQTTVIRDTWWGQDEVTETSDDYYIAQDEYYQKQRRDDAREYLKSEPLDIYNFELFYYEADKAEPVSLGEYLVFDDDFVEAYGNNMIMAYGMNQDDLKMLKMSDIYNDYYYLESYFNDLEHLLSYMHFEAYIGSEKYALGDDILDFDELMDGGDMNFYSDAKSGNIYFEKRLADGDKELYKVTPNKGELQLTLIDDDYDTCDVTSVPGSVITYKDIDSGYYSGDMYINGEKIDTDVYPYIFIASPKEENVVYYFKDYDDGTGDLYKCTANNKKSVKIDSDVYAKVSELANVEGGKLAYIKDYSYGSETGDLMLYDGKSSIRIDKDVSCILFDIMADYNDIY